MSNVKVVGKDSKGNEVVSFVRRPNAKDFREAKLYSNSVVASMLKTKDAEGKPAFIVRSQLPELRKDAGIWTDKHQDRFVEISNKIDELEKKLFAGGKKSEGKKLAFEISDLRDEQLMLFSKLNSLDETTVEATSENAEFDYLVSLCFLNEEGNRVFDSVDSYKEHAADEPYHFTVCQELQKIVYGLGRAEQSIKDRPENRFLLKFGFMNDKMQLVDKDNNLVNRDGKRIDLEGYYVNDAGERVDKDGNKLDSNGNPQTDFGEFTDE